MTGNTLPQVESSSGPSRGVEAISPTGSDPSSSVGRSSSAPDHKEGRKLPISCQQCRGRKVKCDRVKPSCGACSRLKFDCSYNEASSGRRINNAAIPIAPHPDELTQGGTKRKRSRLACDACRAIKAKCTGTTPCQRCETTGLRCEMRQEDLNEQAPLPLEAEAGASLLADKTFVRRCIEAYFDSAAATTCVFLLRPQVLADWTSDRLEPTLLKVLVAAGLRTLREVPRATATAATWMQQAQKQIVGRTGAISLTRVQILVLLVRFHTMAGSLLEAWELISLAARLAFTMRLNWEDTSLSPAAQETRRRLMWTIFLTDRHLCGGVEELAVCPQDMMHVRLPCDDHTFRRGIPSQAKFLGDRLVPENAAHMDIMAYYIRLSAARHRILVYTKRVRRLNESPAVSRDEYNALQQELDSVQATLPVDFRLSAENTRVMVHSPDANGYLALHTLWLQCYCDLNRFFIPGLRESVGPEAMAQTPPDIIEHCQRACLSSAIRLCDFWSEVNTLEPATSTDDMFLAVSIYQVAQILQHARHMLASDGPHCIESLRAALRGALQLASCLRTTFPRASDCLMDAQRLVTMLGQEDAQSRSSSADERGEGPHLPSRHSLLSEVTLRSGDGQRRRPRDAGRATSDVPSSTSANSAWISDSQSPALSWQQGGARLPPPGSVSFLVEAQPEEQDAGLYLLDDGAQGFPSRGPSYMEMNDYYDPELGQLLLSMSTESWA